MITIAKVLSCRLARYALDNYAYSNKSKRLSYKARKPVHKRSYHAKHPI